MCRLSQSMHVHLRVLCFWQLPTEWAVTAFRGAALHPQSLSDAEHASAVAGLLCCMPWGWSSHYLNSDPCTTNSTTRAYLLLDSAILRPSLSTGIVAQQQLQPSAVQFGGAGGPYQIGQEGQGPWQGECEWHGADHMTSRIQIAIAYTNQLALCMP